VVSTSLPTVIPGEGLSVFVRHLQAAREKRAVELQGCYPLAFPDIYRQTGYLGLFTVEEIGQVGRMSLQPVENEDLLHSRAEQFVESAFWTTSSMAHPADLRLVQFDNGSLRLKEHSHFGHSSSITRKSWVTTLCRMLRFVSRSARKRPLHGAAFLNMGEIASICSPATSHDSAVASIMRLLVLMFFEVDEAAFAQRCILPGLFCALAVKQAPGPEGQQLSLYKSSRLAQELTCALNVIKQASLVTFVLARHGNKLAELPGWFSAGLLMQRPGVAHLIADIALARRIGSAANLRQVQYTVLEQPKEGDHLPPVVRINDTVICSTDFATVLAYVIATSRQVLRDALKGWPHVEATLDLIDTKGPVRFSSATDGISPLASYTVNFGTDMTGDQVRASIGLWLQQDASRMENFLSKMDSLQQLLTTGNT